MTFLPRATRPAAVGSTVALAVAAALLAPSPAYAAANAVPTYEVKINLTTAALDASFAPSTAVKSAFGITGSAKARSYSYYDTDALALDAQGWSVRLRHKSGSSFEETYKKRFPVTNGDIDAALTTANAAGFDSTDTNYDAEVDWGYAKQTLSFSNEKSHSSSGYSGTAMPTSTTGRTWLVNDIPGKLQDWNSTGWGKTTLQASRAHGPVNSKVYGGAWGPQTTPVSRCCRWSARAEPAPSTSSSCRSRPTRTPTRPTCTRTPSPSPRPTAGSTTGTSSRRSSSSTATRTHDVGARSPRTRPDVANTSPGVARRTGP